MVRMKQENRKTSKQIRLNDFSFVCLCSIFFFLYALHAATISSSSSSMFLTLCSHKAFCTQYLLCTLASNPLVSKGSKVYMHLLVPYVRLSLRTLAALVNCAMIPAILVCVFVGVFHQTILNIQSWFPLKLSSEGSMFCFSSKNENSFEVFTLIVNIPYLSFKPRYISVILLL